MAYSPEDLYVAGIMARDAANNRDGGVSNSEQQSNDLAVFAAMAMDKENLQGQNSSACLTEVAKNIYSRVSLLLKEPQNVNAVYRAKFEDGNRTPMQIFEDAFDVGYYTMHDRTVYEEMQHTLQREISTHLENGSKDKAEALTEKSKVAEEVMMGTAIPAICDGLKEGSIPFSFASQSDEEILNALIASDNKKEMEIQTALNPVVKDVYTAIAELGHNESQSVNLEQE